MGTKNRVEKHRSFQDLENEWSLPGWILKVFGTIDSFFLKFSTILKQNVYNHYPMTVLPLYLEIRLSFSSPQMGKNCVSRWSAPWASPITDWDYLDYGHVTFGLRLPVKFWIINWCYNGMRSLGNLAWDECILHASGMSLREPDGGLWYTNQLWEYVNW